MAIEKYNGAFEPKEVLRFFEEICAIPHGSGNLDKISHYLVKFAEDRGLKYRIDEKKNVIIWKPATKGNENCDAVIIQGHMDMVAVKTSDCSKNMETEGLDLQVIDGEWLTAKDTSLGGDDGIAVAYGLALLDSDSIKHPPIELVITSDEEIGLLGAEYLDTSDLKGKYLINIDSEDEGIFTVSCAGGACKIMHFPLEKESCLTSKISVKINGLKGGHSGVDINKGKLNAIVAATRLLSFVKSDAKLISINGGEKDNVIAQFVNFDIACDNEKLDSIENLIVNEFNEIEKEYALTEPDIKLEITKEMDKRASVLTKESSDRIINAITALPNGVIRMNPEVEGMVQTSLNLGIISTKEDEVIVTTLIRSSSNSEKEFLARKLDAITCFAKGTVDTEGAYPGWEYKTESRLRDLMVEAYKEQYGEEPVVEGIHAGLECGLFADKIPGLDCVSFGPQMHDIHSVNEVLSISSVERSWTLLKNLLSKLC